MFSEDKIIIDQFLTEPAFMGKLWFNLFHHLDGKDVFLIVFLKVFFKNVKEHLVHFFLNQIRVNDGGKEVSRD